MAEWFSYALTDFLLFSPETYDRLFGLANRSLWPAPLVAIAIAVAMAVLLVRGGPAAGRTVAALLAACWLFVALAWHLERYATINWAASWFAAGFAVQAFVLLWSGGWRGALRLRRGAKCVARAAPDPVTVTGWVIVFFAVVGYPLLAPLSGRPWIEAQVFAIAPDPTVAATLGVLLAAEHPPWRLFVLPVLWAAISGATLWAMGATEALLLPGLAAGSLLLAATAEAARIKT